MATREAQIEASCYAGESRSFVGTFRDFDRGERLRRAAARFFPLLGGALVSLPIPGWHFAGVPGFLIAAVVFGRRALREDSRLEQLRGPCPSCGAEGEYPAPPALLDGSRVTCPGCGEFVALSLPAS